jgi:hypothetical protein
MSFSNLVYYTKASYYIGSNAYLVTSAASQTIPNWVWGVYQVYQNVEFLRSNTSYVLGKMRKYYYGEGENPYNLCMITVFEEGDFVIIDI